MQAKERGGTEHERGVYIAGLPGPPQTGCGAAAGPVLVDGFPVLSAGPTPRTPLEEWDFSIVGEVDEPKRWTWEEFRQLPSEEVTVDIH